MAIHLYPYKFGLESCERLRDKLQELNGGQKIWQISIESSKVTAEDTVFTWGCSTPGTWNARRVINPSRSIRKAVDKLLTFELLSEAGVSHVPYTRYKQIAEEWLENGDTVFCRGQTRGFDGAGISIIRPGSDLIHANLYTKMLPSTQEYRCYVYGNQAFASRNKVFNAAEIKEDAHPEEFRDVIRTTSNGWVFSTNVVDILPEYTNLAVQAVRALGLTFGGVDVLVSNHRPFILEVNTAPWLSELLAGRLATRIWNDV